MRGSRFLLVIPAKAGMTKNIEPIRERLDFFGFRYQPEIASRSC